MPNTPNMLLPQSTIGTSSGLQWEQNLNSSLTLIDAHDHSPGKGVPINSTSISISADLPLNNNNLTLIRSLRFQPQPMALSQPADLGCLYEAGVDLWYNDGNGNQVQLTSGGLVNATSSGISSPPASASFVSSVLVVNAAATTPANIQGASLLLGNNVANSKYLTLSPPSAMAANYGLVLPALPPGQQIMTLDSSGNITAPYTVDGSTIVVASNVIKVPLGGITTTQIASDTILDGNIAVSTITIDKLAPMPIQSSVAGLNEILQVALSSTPNVSTSPVLLAQGTLTTGGRPISFSLQPDGGGNLSFIRADVPTQAPSGVFILFQLDSGSFYAVELGASLNSFSIGVENWQPPGAATALIPASAGTHTISVYSQVPVGTHQITTVHCLLTAYEI